MIDEIILMMRELKLGKMAEIWTKEDKEIAE